MKIGNSDYGYGICATDMIKELANNERGVDIIYNSVLENNVNADKTQITKDLSRGLVCGNPIATILSDDIKAKYGVQMYVFNGGTHRKTYMVYWENYPFGVEHEILGTDKITTIFNEYCTKLIGHTLPLNWYDVYGAIDD